MFSFTTCCQVQMKLSPQDFHNFVDKFALRKLTGGNMLE